MDARLKKNEIVDFVHFSCSMYKKHGTKACSSHRIEARDLYNIVLEDIQYHGQMALSSKEDLVEKIAERIDKDKFKERKNSIQKLKDSKDKLSELDKSFEKLYEDRLSESITERNFNMMNAKLSKKQDEILDEIHSLEEQIKMVTQKQENCEKFIENLSKYAKIKELNRYILNQVIDKIYVYDQEEVDGELKQEVEIHYKLCSAPIDAALEAASRCRLQVVGFARGDRMTLYGMDC